MIPKILNFLSKRLELVLALLAVAAVAAAAVLWFKLADAQREASIAESNAIALQDEMRIYRNDQRVAVSLMQIQAEIDSDSIRSLETALAAALNDRDQSVDALVNLQIAFDAMRGSITADPVVVEEATTASFEITGPPISGDVSVTAPEPPAPWRLAYDLTVWPIDLTYTSGCDADNNALVTIEGPEWANLRVSRGTVDPARCHPRAVPTFRLKSKSKWAFGGFLLGLAVAHWSDDGFAKAIIPGG